jgi:hypothetical protein
MRSDEMAYYDADSLENGLREFERAYGLDSDALYDLYVANDLPPELPRFQALVWASFVEDVRRLRGDDAGGEDTMARVRRSFAHA